MVKSARKSYYLVSIIFISFFLGNLDSILLYIWVAEGFFPILLKGLIGFILIQIFIYLLIDINREASLKKKKDVPWIFRSIVFNKLIVFLLCAGVLLVFALKVNFDYKKYLCREGNSQLINQKSCISELNKDRFNLKKMITNG